MEKLKNFLTNLDKKEIEEIVDQLIDLGVEINLENDLVEEIVKSNRLLLEGKELVYLEDELEEEKKIVVIRRKDGTEKLKLGSIWLDFKVTGKNRHIERIKAMRLNAKRLGYGSSGKLDNIELSEYNEEHNVNLYIQSRYVKDWSLDIKVTEENIKNVDGDMKLLLDRATLDFLNYRKNGLALSEEEEEKKN